VTSGPSSAATTKPPELSPLEQELEPEYARLHYIDVGVKDGEGFTTQRGLVDSGSQGSCIQRELSKDALTTHKLKPSPTVMVMADGNQSPAGPITHHDITTICIAGHEEQVALDVASLSHPLIIGMPWLRKHNPHIDYHADTMTFRSDFCRQNCEHYDRTIALYPTDQPNQELSHKPELSHQPEPGPQPVPKTRKAPQVALIGAAAFAHVCNQPGTELFFLSMSELQEAQLAHQEVATTGTEVDLSAIPPEYHEFADLFSKKEADKLPPHKPYDHQIPLEPGKAPPFGPIYKCSPAELEAVRKYVEEHLRKGFIRHSQSSCSSPIVFAKKKDGTLRICVDYRGLNKLTIKNRYPLPLIGELLERMNNAKYFTKFDVRDGYNRLRMAPGEEWKTAFRCRYGLFEYTVMPFGLCNAPGTFQHYMNDVFRDFLDDFLVVYLDDMLIYSRDQKEHKAHVRKVLERLREAGLFLKPSKCQFHVQEVEFLGFVIGEKGVSMDPSKVDSITSWPTPKSPHDVRMFLGLANFYRRFIRDFSKMAAPLTRLLKKESLMGKFIWDGSSQRAFDQLRRAFTTAPVLQHFDETKPAILEADASDLALGAVVSQYGEDGLLHPVAYHSRKFGPAELNYEIYDKELLAIVDSLEHYRHMFEGLGQQITIYSDHHNLLWFTETKIYNRRQARWAEKLSKYDLVIHFRPGTKGGRLMLFPADQTMYQRTAPESHHPSSSRNNSPARKPTPSSWNLGVC